MKKQWLILSTLIASSILRAENAPVPHEGVDFKEGKGGELSKLPLPDPEPIALKDGKKGWKLKIPGGRPLATPALSGGILFVGGGFGSHEFYALDAKTGKPAWSFKTGDDGPTAAVVAENCVAYNTESCTVYVHEARTGKLLWSKWLGDPLMSQPAIGGGRLFMAYPGQGGHHLAAFELRTGKVVWDQKINAEIISAPVLDGNSCYAATCNGTLYHFDQASGKQYFAQDYNITSAPVIVEGKPYFSQRCVKDIEVAAADGKGERKTSHSTLEGFNTTDPTSGELAFKEPQAAIKAGYLLSPDRARQQYAANAESSVGAQAAARGGAGKAVFALKNAGAIVDSNQAKTEEIVKRLAEYQKKPVEHQAEGGVKDADDALALSQQVDKLGDEFEKVNPDKPELARELKSAAGEIRANATKTKDASQTVQNIASNLKGAEIEAKEAQQNDAAVAFATAPAAAKLEDAKENLGQANVKSVWAYQGSRPLPLGDRCVVVQGNAFRALDNRTDKVAWEKKLESKVDATRPATPPALAGGKIYMGTADGRIICASPETGKTAWEAEVGGNIVFQPAVAEGRVYVATNDGSLICVETGDETADGWTMWGGSAMHNGPEKK